MKTWQIIQGDAIERLKELPERSVQTCVTSPPYFGHRDYGDPGQIGLEPTPDEYVQKLVEVFREVRRVLRDDGTVWLNLGDSFGPNKQLLGVPWRVAFALQVGGWFLRSDIIWAKLLKPNPMPESVTDRPTKAHEYLFLLSKSKSYFYDADAVREEHTVAPEHRRERVTPGARRPGAFARSFEAGNGDGDGNSRGYPNGGRNKRSVWTVATQPFPGAHFAVFPPKLIEPCVLAGSSHGTTVLDPFAGAGTTGLVATRHGRSFIGIELNPEYAELARGRIIDDAPLFNTFSEAA
jgi:DNA modification methylase